MFKINGLTTLICIQVLAPVIMYGTDYITAASGHGRFGHQLLNYVKAKVVAHKEQLPFLYNPFLFSHKLQLHKTEKSLCPNTNEFLETKYIRNTAEISVARNSLPDQGDRLFIISLRTLINPFRLSDEYRDYLRSVIAPIQSARKNTPPDITTIAIHIRRGDCLKSKKYFGIKSHADKFYIEKLLRLLAELETKQKIKHCYIRIYTDDPQPELLAKKIANQIVISHRGLRQKKESLHLQLNNLLITIRWKKNNRHSSEDILQDFFDIASSDYLIRPFGSYFSLMAQFIGKHKKVLAIGTDNAEIPNCPGIMETI